MLKKLLKISIPVVLVALVFAGWFQRWQIHDHLRLRGYTPSTQIAQLATDTSMSDYARRIFYVYHPELDTKETFNKNCSSSEKTIVLGCYVDGQGIYIYGVTDERLTGILQVTAAHEMLHAVYGRLGQSEKSKVNAMLVSAFEKIADERIRNTIEDYRKNGADVNNELHSILGSEVRTLPADLEAYYKRYFTNRLAVVGYSERYEKVFTDRKKQVEVYDKQLEDLRKRIDTAQADLDSRSKSLTEQKNQLNSLLSARNYSEYNAGVGPYNGAVSAYNASVRTVRGLIDQYNNIVAARNAVVMEEGELTKAIDSRPDTINAQ